MRSAALKLCVSAVIAGSLLTACNRGSSGTTGNSGGSGQVKVGVVVKTLSNPVWKGVADGAQAEAKKLGNVEVQVTGAQTEQDIQGQISKIDSFISQGVKALLVAPNGAAQLQPTLQRAADKGIKVILIDTDISTFSAKTSFVGSSEADGATTVAQYLVKTLGDKAKGTQAGVLDYPGNPTVQTRVDAGKKVMQDAGMTVVSTLPGLCDRATALNATQAMLQSNPNIGAIFGSCGQNATGATQAVVNARKSVQVVGFDGINDEFADIKSGTMLATEWQDFPTIGAKAVDAAIDSINGKKVEANIAVPAKLITKDDVSQYNPY